MPVSFDARFTSSLREDLSDMPGPTVRRDGWNRSLMHDPELPVDLVETLWTDADSLLDESMLIKDGGRCTVLKFERGGRSWILKRYNMRGPLHTAAHAIMQSRARRNWLFGRRLMAVGILTPPPMACLEHRLGPFRARSFLVTPFVEGAELRRELGDGIPSDLDHLAAEFECLWSKLGELRLSHGDMKTTNLLVTQDRRLMLIDLDGMRFHRFDATLRPARRRDRSRFFRDWQRTPEVSEAFRRHIERKEAA